MSTVNRNIQVTTCDRCGNEHQVDTSKNSSNPPGWARVKAQSSSGHSIVAGRYDFDLCNLCTADLQEWFTNTDGE